MENTDNNGKDKNKQQKLTIFGDSCINSSNYFLTDHTMIQTNCKKVPITQGVAKALRTLHLDTCDYLHKRRKGDKIPRK